MNARGIYFSLWMMVLVGRGWAVDWRAGVAREDVSPTTPVRLSGYAARTKEAQGVAQRLWVKALAISEGEGPPALLLTVDNCGVCAPVVEEVARRLEREVGLVRERFTVASSHTHSAPHTRGFAANIFVADLPADEQGRVEGYSDFLVERMVSAGRAAIAGRRPVELKWNEGQVGFARNRRTVGGPVDLALPVLCVVGREGGTLAVVANYACHCTTLGGEFNEAHGDWAGCAQVEMEKRFPGAVAMITIGCGGDANPYPRGSVKLAEEHGRELAVEAETVAHNACHRLEGGLVCRLKRLELPFSPAQDREGWRRQAEQPGILGYLAKKKLAQLNAGGSLPRVLPYTVQTWSFGEGLTMVFLAGEVVVDYGLRLKEVFDAERLWITSYANDVPCYIPSKRILAEGGYEAESSLWYYDRASRLSPEAEDVLVGAVEELMPVGLKKDAGKAASPPARSAGKSLAARRVGGGLEIELVAAEPLVKDPIAVDWDARGRLWVLEMGDYPLGTDGKGKPGGRVKRLEDTDGDGRPDRAVVFMEGVAFPTGMMCWRDGVFVCSAPDILFARDTDGDGKADEVVKKYSGWPTDNYNARVNSLSLGLDGWIYGSGGIFGAEVEPGKVNTRGRDFRFHPETGVIEAASGQTQQGRVRDDWDNWFGCDNSNLLWHYPLPEAASRRNPRVAAPAPNVNVPAYPDPNRLHPTSRLAERYNDFEMANRTTSACGLGIYRDTWLGEEYYGNAFTCEAVHNLVRRHLLEPNGATFAGRKGADEEDREFLSTRDNWTRFAQARTGPDGALWLVDMYRFVIEHPTWIPKEVQKRLDLRAGADRGRIYRLKVRGKELRPVVNLAALATPELAGRLDSPNGTERDRVHGELLGRKDREKAVPRLAELASRADWPATRAQAAAILQAVQPDHAAVAGTLKDPDARVRRMAVRLLGGKHPDVATLAEDADAAVRFEVALSMPPTPVLTGLLKDAVTDAWMRAAILSAVGNDTAALLPAAMAMEDSEGKTTLLDGLLASAQQPLDLLPTLLSNDGAAPGIWQMRVISGWLKQGDLKPADVAGLLPAIRKSAAGGSVEALRMAARAGAETAWLADFVPGPLEAAALEELSVRDDASVPELFLKRWKTLGPASHERILRALLARPLWIAAVLDAVEAGSVQPGEISLTDRQRLATDSERAKKLVGITGMGLPEEKLQRFADVDQRKGDAANGSMVFARTCATCHALRGTGFAVGPDLGTFRAKPVADFLTAILTPSSAIEPRFIACTVRTNDGRTLAGIVREETATSLTVAQPGGITETLLRSNVAEIATLPISLMPEGLDATLTPQEMADLIAFVRQSAAAPFGQSTAEQMEQARLDFIRAGSSLGKVIKSAESLTYPGWIGKRPLAYCRQKQGLASLSWESKADWKAGGEGIVRFRFAAAMGFASQPEGKFSLRVNGSGPLDFNVSLTDASWRSTDGRISMQYTVSEVNAEDSCGTVFIAVPVEVLTSGKPALFEVSALEAGSERWFGIYQVE